MLSHMLRAAGSTLTYLAGSTSTASTIVIPSATSAGDLIFLLQYASNSTFSVPSAVVPTGFTSIFNMTGGSTYTNRMTGTYKIAASGDGGKTITGMNGDFNDKVIAVFRFGPTGIQTVTVSTPSTEFSVVKPAAQTVTVSGISVPLIVFGCYRQSTTQTGQTMSPTESGTISSTRSPPINIRYKLYGNGSVPANATIDEADGGTNFLASFYIKLN